MLIKNKNTFQTNEIIDIDKAKYILSLDSDTLEQIIGGKEWKGETIFSNKSVYIKQLTTWLKSSINNITHNNSINTEYKYSVDAGSNPLAWSKNRRSVTVKAN